MDMGVSLMVFYGKLGYTASFLHYIYGFVTFTFSIYLWYFHVHIDEYFWARLKLP